MLKVMWRALCWLYRRPISEVSRSPRLRMAIDAKLYRVGQYMVGVSGQQMIERRPWQTPEQIAWQNALDGWHLPAQVQAAWKRRPDLELEAWPHGSGDGAIYERTN